jgi:hypothetical protein
MFLPGMLLYGSVLTSLLDPATNHVDIRNVEVSI